MGSRMPWAWRTSGVADKFLRKRALSSEGSQTDRILRAGPSFLDRASDQRPVFLYRNGFRQTAFSNRGLLRTRQFFRSLEKFSPGCHYTSKDMRPGLLLLVSMLAQAQGPEAASDAAFGSLS